MQPEPQERQRAEEVRDLQIVVVSMAVGVLMLIGVASVVGPVGLDKPWGRNVARYLPHLVVGCGVMALVGQGLLATVLTRSARRNITRLVVEDARMAVGLDRVPGAVLAYRLGGLLPLFRVTTILRSAVLGGAALLCGVAYLLEGSYVALGGAVLLTLALATRIPTGIGVESWLADQTRIIEDQCRA